MIDSLNGYQAAMPEEQALILHMHELLQYLNRQGLTTFLTVAQHGLVGDMKAPVDVTYLADTVILLRYFEALGRVRRAISVIKKRTGAHEDTIRESASDRPRDHAGRAADRLPGRAARRPDWARSPLQRSWSGGQCERRSIRTGADPGAARARRRGGHGDAGGGGLGADDRPRTSRLVERLDRRAPGFAVVTEEALRTGGPPPAGGLDRRQPEWSDFPFVLLTQRGGGLERNPAAAAIWRCSATSPSSSGRSIRPRWSASRGGAAGPATAV